MNRKKIRKHLTFKIIEHKPKTKVYNVISNYDNSLLGSIYWYGKWRQYIFEPDILAKSIWSWDCLLEIVEFIQRIMKRNNK